MTMDGTKFTPTNLEVSVQEEMPEKKKRLRKTTWARGRSKEYVTDPFDSQDSQARRSRSARSRSLILL